jgi:hypothetical protein
MELEAMQRARTLTSRERPRLTVVEGGEGNDAT